MKSRSLQSAMDTQQTILPTAPKRALLLLILSQPLAVSSYTVYFLNLLESYEGEKNLKTNRDNVNFVLERNWILKLKHDNSTKQYFIMLTERRFAFTSCYPINQNQI